MQAETNCGPTRSPSCLMRAGMKYIALCFCSQLSAWAKARNKVWTSARPISIILMRQRWAEDCGVCVCVRVHPCVKKENSPVATQKHALVLPYNPSFDDIFPLNVFSGKRSKATKHANAAAWLRRPTGTNPCCCDDVGLKMGARGGGS